ncbi:MAG: hypothetical protein LBQ87_06370, partial [Candidatus Fibromonas sp.]|nr:hypothetical protein [Candidatus Fibromonas sp.]
MIEGGTTTVTTRYYGIKIIRYISVGVRYAQKSVIDCKPFARGKHSPAITLINGEPEFVSVNVFSVVVRGTHR